MNRHDLHPGPALARHHGTLAAGGGLWLVPIVLVPLSLSALVHAQWLMAALLGVLGFGLAAVNTANWRQTIELFPAHLVWRKWGRARLVPYSEVQRTRAGSRSAGRSSHTSLFQQSYLDIFLHGGEVLTLLEMKGHFELARQLEDLVAAAKAER